jgi:hypothetical protein
MSSGLAGLRGRLKVRIGCNGDRWVGLVVWGLVLAAMAHPATGAAPIYQVEGQGAILRNDQAAARQRALQGSLRKAVERTVDEVLSVQARVANIQVLEEQVYQRASRYIRSYRVLWEYPDVGPQVYRLRIEAEVALEDLRAAIEQLGLSESGQGTPRVLILIGEAPETEARFSGQAARVLGRVLRQEFEADRFRVVQTATGRPWDGQEASALEVARAANADVVLVGSALMRKTHEGVAGLALQTVQVAVQMRAWVPQTGIQLAFKRAGMAVDHIDPLLAGQQALEQTAVDLATQLLPELQIYRQQNASGMERRQPPRF